MADVKISELPVASSVATPDVVPIVQGGVTKQADVALLPGSGSTVVFSNPGGRLTTESGVPVSTSDRTSQGTLYYTPYKHNNIYTYSGTEWQAKTFSEISLSLSVTSGKNYDVFINSAATTLSLSAAWSSDTARTDALGTQDGVTVLSSDHTKLWLGTIRASGSNVTEDSAGGVSSQVGGKRFVWNAYNSVLRTMGVTDSAVTWSYTSATIRQADGASGNKVEYVTGDVAQMIHADVCAAVAQSVNVLQVAKAGVGIDSTTTISGRNSRTYNSGGGFTTQSALIGNYSGMPGLGYHYISWNESGADDQCLFVGNSESGLVVEGLF